MEPITVRASSLPSYPDCQLRFAVKTLYFAFREHGFDLLPDRTNYGALVGTGVHGGAELGLKEKLATGTVAPLDAMEDAAIGAFRERMSEEAGEDRPVVEDPTTRSVNDAEKQVRRMTEVYRTDIAEACTPVVVESRLEARYNDLIRLSGQADVLVITLPEVAQAIRDLNDLKTGRNLRNLTQHQPQLGIYIMLMEAHGHEVDGANIHGIPRAPVGKPQPRAELHALDPDVCWDRAKAILDDFAPKARAFLRDGDARRFLANPKSMLCSPHYCPAYGTRACPATYTGE